VKALRDELAELVYNPLKIVTQLDHALVVHVFTLFLATLFLILSFFFAVPTLRAAAVGLKWRFTLRAGLSSLSAHGASKDHQ
jgi:hypothetical protein